MPRQPSRSFNTERFMQRVEDRITRSFDVISDELGKLAVEVRKGNLSTELLEHRMSDLEVQIIETREQMQRNKQARERDAEVVATAAVGAAQLVVHNAKDAPKKVWKTPTGRITAMSAVIVAIVAIGNNLPKLVRGADEVTRGVWTWLLHHG